MWICFKTAFLFIGAMVGAGFATGSELLVFFGDTGITSPILAALMIGGLTVLFAFAGGILAKYRRVSKAIDIAVYLSCLITFITMAVGAEEILEDSFGIKYLGLATAIIVSVLSMFSMNCTKILNAIIVPVLILLMILLAIKADMPPIGYDADFGSSLAYACMNMLLGGYMLSKECARMSAEKIWAVAGIITLSVSVMLAVMYCLALCGEGNSMPVYEASMRVGLAGICAIIIYLAILSTLIGAAKVIYDGAYSVTKRKYPGVVFLLILSVACYGVDFGYMVEAFYPLSGYVGIVIVTVIGALTATERLRRNKTLIIRFVKDKTEK